MAESDEFIYSIVKTVNDNLGITVDGTKLLSLNNEPLSFAHLNDNIAEIINVIKVEDDGDVKEEIDDYSYLDETDNTIDNPICMITNVESLAEKPSSHNSNNDKPTGVDGKKPEDFTGVCVKTEDGGVDGVKSEYSTGVDCENTEDFSGVDGVKTERNSLNSDDDFLGFSKTDVIAVEHIKHWLDPYYNAALNKIDIKMNYLEDKNRPSSSNVIVLKNSDVCRTQESLNMVVEEGIFTKENIILEAGKDFLVHNDTGSNYNTPNNFVKEEVDISDVEFDEYEAGSNLDLDDIEPIDCLVSAHDEEENDFESLPASEDEQIEIESDSDQSVHSLYHELVKENLIFKERPRIRVRRDLMPQSETNSRKESCGITIIPCKGGHKLIQFGDADVFKQEYGHLDWKRILKKTSLSEDLFLIQHRISKMKDLSEIREQLEKDLNTFNDELERINDIRAKITEHAVSEIILTDGLARYMAYKKLQKQKDKDEKKMEEFKYNIWCVVCLKRARFICCWGWNYCSISCQDRHWPKHKRYCQQSKMPVNEPNMRLNPRSARILQRTGRPMKENRSVSKSTPLSRMNKFWSSLRFESKELIAAACRSELSPLPENTEEDADQNPKRPTSSPGPIPKKKVRFNLESSKDVDSNTNQSKPLRKSGKKKARSRKNSSQKSILKKRKKKRPKKLSLKTKAKILKMVEDYAVRVQQRRPIKKKPPPKKGSIVNNAFNPRQAQQEMRVINPGYQPPPEPKKRGKSILQKSNVTNTASRPNGTNQLINQESKHDEVKSRYSKIMNNPNVSWTLIPKTNELPSFNPSNRTNVVAKGNSVKRLQTPLVIDLTGEQATPGNSRVRDNSLIRGNMGVTNANTVNPLQTLKVIDLPRSSLNSGMGGVDKSPPKEVILGSNYVQSSPQFYILPRNVDGTANTINQMNVQSSDQSGLKLQQGYWLIQQNPLQKVNNGSGQSNIVTTSTPNVQSNELMSQSNLISANNTVGSLIIPNASSNMIKPNNQQFVNGNVINTIFLPTMLANQYTTNLVPSKNVNILPRTSNAEQSSLHMTQLNKSSNFSGSTKIIKVPFTLNSSTARSATQHKNIASTAVPGASVINRPLTNVSSFDKFANSRTSPKVITIPSSPTVNKITAAYQRQDNTGTYSRSYKAAVNSAATTPSSLVSGLSKTTRTAVSGTSDINRSLVNVSAPNKVDDPYKSSEIKAIPNSLNVPKTRRAYQRKNTTATNSRPKKAAVNSAATAHSSQALDQSKITGKAVRGTSDIDRSQVNVSALYKVGDSNKSTEVIAIPNSPNVRRTRRSYQRKNTTGINSRSKKAAVNSTTGTSGINRSLVNMSALDKVGNSYKSSGIIAIPSSRNVPKTKRAYQRRNTTGTYNNPKKAAVNSFTTIPSSQVLSQSKITGSAALGSSDINRSLSSEIIAIPSSLNVPKTKRAYQRRNTTDPNNRSKKAAVNAIGTPDIDRSLVNVSAPGIVDSFRSSEIVAIPTSPNVPKTRRAYQRKNTFGSNSRSKKAVVNSATTAHSSQALGKSKITGTAVPRTSYINRSLVNVPASDDLEVVFQRFPNSTNVGKTRSAHQRGTINSFMKAAAKSATCVPSNQVSFNVSQITGTAVPSTSTGIIHTPINSNLLNMSNIDPVIIPSTSKGITHQTPRFSNIGQSNITDPTVPSTSTGVTRTALYSNLLNLNDPAVPGTSTGITHAPLYSNIMNLSSLTNAAVPRTSTGITHTPMYSNLINLSSLTDQAIPSTSTGITHAPLYSNVLDGSNIVNTTSSSTGSKSETPLFYVVSLPNYECPPNS